MAGIVVEIDQEKLWRAREILGTETDSETVQMALDAVIRRAATEDLFTLAEEGVFDVLLEPAKPDSEHR